MVKQHPAAAFRRSRSDRFSPAVTSVPHRRRSSDYMHNSVDHEGEQTLSCRHKCPWLPCVECAPRYTPDCETAARMQLWHALQIFAMLLMMRVLLGILKHVAS